MPSDTGRWCRAADLAAITEDEPLGVEVEGIPIALYRVDGEFFATSNICTHAFALLSDGWTAEGVVECPLHNAQFDVRTGKALSSPAEEPLQTFPVRVQEGELQVQLPD